MISGHIDSLLVIVGGTIANVKTQAQYDQILALMDQTGVNNAWICNEVADPGVSTGQAGDFTAWSSDDVSMPASGLSKYYEPARELAVVRGTCPGPLSGRPFIDNTVPHEGPDCPTTALGGLCGDPSVMKQNYVRTQAIYRCL